MRKVRSNTVLLAVVLLFLWCSGTLCAEEARTECADTEVFEQLLADAHYRAFSATYARHKERKWLMKRLETARKEAREGFQSTAKFRALEREHAALKSDIARLETQRDELLSRLLLLSGTPLANHE